MAPPYAPYDFPNFFYLDPGLMTAGSSGFTVTTLSSTTLKVAWKFTVPNDVSTAITKVLFRYGTRTGTPPTYRVSLQSLNASGFPDGTVLGGGSPASTTFTPPADTSWNATIQELTLDNSYLATPGQMLSIVIDYSSGTVDASNCGSFSRSVSDWTNISRQGFPVAATYSGSWGVPTGVQPVYGYGTADGRYWGFPQLASATNTVGTSGYRAAMRFYVPPQCCESFSVGGLRVVMNAPSAGSNSFTVGLWDQAGKLIQGTTIDSDVPVNGATRYVFYNFTTKKILYPGNTYYLGIECVSGSFDTYCLTTSTAAQMSAFNGPDDINYATWNGSAWTVDATSRPPFIPIGITIRNRRRLRGGRLGEVH